MAELLAVAEHRVFRSAADRARGGVRTRRGGPRQIPGLAPTRDDGASPRKPHEGVAGIRSHRLSRVASTIAPTSPADKPGNRRAANATRAPVGSSAAPRRAAPRVVWSTRRRSPRRTTSRPRGVEPSLARSIAPRAARVSPTQRRPRGLVVAAAAWFKHRGGGPGVGASSRSAPGRLDPRWSDAGRSTPPRRWRLAHAGSGLGGARARTADSRVRTTLTLLGA